MPDFRAKCIIYKDVIKVADNISLFFNNIKLVAYIVINKFAYFFANTIRVKTLIYNIIFANSRFFGINFKKMSKIVFIFGI